MTTLVAYFDFARALGGAYVAAARREEVDKLFAEAMPVIERALAAHPDSNQWRADLAVMAWNRAQIAHRKGHLDRSDAFREQARNELEEAQARGVRLTAQLLDMLAKLKSRR